MRTTARAKIRSSIHQLLDAATSLLEGGGEDSAAQISQLAENESAASEYALRLCASEILVAYKCSGAAPAHELLRAMIRSVVRIPKVDLSASQAAALDHATVAMLGIFGVSGFVHQPVKASKREPRDAGWLLTMSVLALPTRNCRTALKWTTRKQIVDAIVLSLLESNGMLSAAALRWFSLCWPRSSEAAVMREALNRTRLLTQEEPRARFNCAVAERVL